MTPSRVGPGEPLAGSDDSPARQSAPSRQALPSASDKPQATSIGPDFEMDCILRIAGGDRSAFEQLFRSYHKRLFRYLCRMLSKADAAEELASDVLFEVWKRASGFRGESKVSTWIFGIARFRAISWLRKSNPKLVDLDDAAMVCDSHELQDEVLVKASTREAVRGALGKLTPQHQEVMELTFYQGFSYPEIATILACPVNTVKTRMFYARKELRDLLREEGSI